MRKLDRGTYTVTLSMATIHGRKTAALSPPQTQLTIMVADIDSHAYYNRTWEQVTSTNCAEDANFPLALR